MLYVEVIDSEVVFQQTCSRGMTEEQQRAVSLLSTPACAEMKGMQCNATLYWGNLQVK